MGKAGNLRNSRGDRGRNFFSVRSPAFGEYMVAAQAFISAEEHPRGLGHIAEGALLALHHMGVEIRRPPHGLAGIIDDEIQPLARRKKMPAESLDAGRMAQVQAEDLQPVAPDLEIRFGGIAHRRVPREAGADYELRPGAEKLYPGLVAYLDAPAGEQGNAAVQVGGLGALKEIQFGAGRAELVVEIVQLVIILFADIAVLLFMGLAETWIVLHFFLLEAYRRMHV